MILSRTLLALCVLCPFAVAQEVSADRAAAQSMKSMAMWESEKLLQNLQDEDTRAILAKIAPKVDYYNKGLILSASCSGRTRKIF
jgi:hypothetical protein